MKESELYAQYIKASRAGNKKEIDSLIQMGFKPDKQRLIELSNNNKALRDILYNRSVIVNIDMGDTAGHVYGKFPIYNEQRTHIKEELLGFYPKEPGVLTAFAGEGAVLNETLKTGRSMKKFQTVQIRLPITEEAWLRLANWTSSKTKEKSAYVLVSTNCVHFVHSALKIAGYSDGLVDKFDPNLINKMKIKPVMLDLNAYLRYDNRENFFPLLNEVIESREQALQNGSYVWHHKEAIAKRAKANQLTQENFVNGFFDRYHDANFYQRLYQDKPLTIEDMSWLLRNKAPGMEDRIRDTLLQCYHKFPLSMKQQYQFNPKYFLWDIGSQLQTCPESIHTDIQRYISSPATAVQEETIHLVKFNSKPKLFAPAESHTILGHSSHPFSFLPTFLYVTPANPRNRQCHNKLEKDKFSKDKIPNNPYVRQVFVRDCERRLDAILGKSKFNHAIAFSSNQSAVTRKLNSEHQLHFDKEMNASVITPSFKQYYIRKNQHIAPQNYLLKAELFKVKYITKNIPINNTDSASIKSRPKEGL